MTVTVKHNKPLSCHSQLSVFSYSHTHKKGEASILVIIRYLIQETKVNRRNINMLLLVVEIVKKRKKE